MLEMDDDTLTAMALREHAQTCDDIAGRYTLTAAGHKNRQSWLNRAARCRELALHHERIAAATKSTPQAVS